MNYLYELIGVESTEKNTILITTSDVKRQVLTYRNDHKIIDNLKIMTEHEFNSAFIFESNLERLIYLINNNPWNSSKLRTSIAIQLEKALYLIDTLNIVEHELYQYLQNVKQEGLSFTSSQIPNNYEVIAYLPRVSDELQANLNIDNFTTSKAQATVYQYDYFLDEIESSVEYILELIESGVQLEDIHFHAPREYHFAIKQAASIYGLPIKNENKLPLLSHIDGASCLRKIENGEELDLSEIDSVLVEPILMIINKYAKFSNKQQCIDLIRYDFQHCEITLHSEGGIELLDKIDSLHTNFDFSFGYFILLGNYQDGLVNYVQDTNIVGDKYRDKLLSCDVRNHLEDSLLSNIISRAKNLRISFAKKLASSNVELSNNLSGSKIIKDQLKSTSKYSRQADYLKFSRANYTMSVFNHQTPVYTDLSIYFEVKLKSNQVSGVNHKFDNLKLSYTSINDYYKCSYKYYLSHVLRVKNGAVDNRKMMIGNIIHHVLENVDKFAEVNAETLRLIIDNYVSENKLEISSVDNLYFDKFSEFLERVCIYMKQEELQSEFDLIKRESSYEMEINNQVSLIGKIDKILSRIEDDNLIVEIYDYKTGSLNVNLENIEYGLNMQNLIYFLLIKDYYKNEDGDEILYGTYQQQIKPKILYDDEEPLDLMKIKGYSMKKNDIIFKRSEKVISQTEIDQLLNTVANKVSSAAENIINNQFEINPKIINKKNVSCEYCPYINICNRTVKDFTFIKKEQ